MKLNSDNLIYIAAYNNSDKIFQLLKDLKNVKFFFDVLVIDDCSTDNTISEIRKFTQKEKYNFNLYVIRMKKNYGYAASQKIAYSIFIEQINCQNIIMLHGDAQYEPILINGFSKFFNSECSIVQGFRDKKIFSTEDQTPMAAYKMIKFLNHYENFIFRTKFKEWHSGFVMYKKKFLKKLQIDSLINSPHIDGNILYTSKLLSEKVCYFEIYKKYKKKNNYNYFLMFKYVFSIFFLPILFLIKNKNFLLSRKISLNYHYEIIDLSFEE